MCEMWACQRHSEMIKNVVVLLQQIGAHLSHLGHALPLFSLQVSRLVTFESASSDSASVMFTTSRLLSFWTFCSSFLQNSPSHHGRFDLPFAVVSVFSVGTALKEGEIRMTLIIICFLREAVFFRVTSAQLLEQRRLVYWLPQLGSTLVDVLLKMRGSHLHQLTDLSFSSEHKWV